MFVHFSPFISYLYTSPLLLLKGNEYINPFSNPKHSLESLHQVSIPLETKEGSVIPQTMSNEDQPSSQPGHISSTMLERLFKGDLLEEQGTESNILSAGEEWVVKSLTEMRGDNFKPPFSDL